MNIPDKKPNLSGMIIFSPVLPCAAGSLLLGTVSMSFVDSGDFPTADFIFWWMQVPLLAIAVLCAGVRAMTAVRGIRKEGR